MKTLRNILTLVLMVCAMPVFAQYGRGKIEIVIDANAHRAYVPFGTILPPGLKVHAAARMFRGRHEPLLNRQALSEPSSPNLAEGRSLLRAQPPLVFEYAPESRFEESRKHHPAVAIAATGDRLKIVPLTQYCWVASVTLEAEGQYGPYIASFDSTFCSSGPQPGQSGTQDFTAYTYPANETWASVGDDLGNYTCFNQPYGYSAASCTASHTSILQLSCANTVYSTGFARRYEWLDYDIYNPIDFYFDVEYCLYSE